MMAHIALTYDNRAVLDWFYHYSRRSCRILDHNWIRLNWGNSCTHSMFDDDDVELDDEVEVEVDVEVEVEVFEFG